MLRFWASEDHKKLSDFVREWLDSDLEMIEDGEENPEEEQKEYIGLLFPEFKWVESRDKCVKTFYEFRARLADDFLHEPTELEWYILMRLHEQWVETRAPLKKKYRNVLGELEGNFDGDCDNVAFLFELYKTRHPRLAKLGYKDLDRFTELMPRDILEEYLVIKAERSSFSV